MMQTIRGYWQDGNIVLDEQPKVYSKIPVLVTFVDEPIELNKTGGIRIGGLEGRFTVPDDFDEPLDDLKEYM